MAGGAGQARPLVAHMALGARPVQPPVRPQPAADCRIPHGCDISSPHNPDHRTQHRSESRSSGEAFAMLIMFLIVERVESGTLFSS
nr:hypothetical protein CFP56_58137 [Quercus suber]